MLERIEAFTDEHPDRCAEVLVSAFSANLWNEPWTLETARKELRWTLDTPDFLGLVSFGEGVTGLAGGYREVDADGPVFYLRTRRGTPAQAFYERNGIRASSQDVLISCDW